MSKEMTDEDQTQFDNQKAYLRNTLFLLMPYGLQLERKVS